MDALRSFVGQSSASTEDRVSKDAKTPEAGEDAAAEAPSAVEARAVEDAKPPEVAGGAGAVDAKADVDASAKADASASADGADGSANADTESARAEAASAPDGAEAAPSATRPDDETDDPAFDALWARVVEAWGDDKPHGAIVEYAIRTHKLPELAGRYKSLSSDPEKGERAKKRLDGVVIAATHLLYSTKSSKPTKTPWQWTVTVGLICALIVSWLAYRILVSRVH